MSFKIRAKRTIKRIAAISVGAAFLGATMAGALATTYSVGASADSAAATKLATGASTTDKVTKDVGIGAGIANTTQPESYHDNPLRDDDLAILQDTEVSFNNGNGYDDYDVSDEIWWGADSPSIETSLSTAAVDKDYMSDVAMEVASDSIFYYYMFDEAINVSMVSEDYPLEVKFFGKDLKITGVGWSATPDADRVTVKVGETFYMSIGDEITVDGHKVKLEDVGDAKIAISVDGGEIVTIDEDASHSWAEGIEVNADSVFYKSGDPTQSTANLVVGEDATKTYVDNDAFIGEDEQDDLWRWDIIDLDASGATTTTVTAAGTATGPVLALKNYFVVDDSSDTNPAPVVNNGCYDMPTKDPFAQLCMDGLSVGDDEYLTLDVDFATVDLRDAAGHYGGLTSAPVLRIKSNIKDSIRLDWNAPATGNAGVGFTGTRGYITSDIETDEIYLFKNASLAGANNPIVEVFYINNDNDFAIAGNITDPAGAAAGGLYIASFAYIDFQDTRATDVQFWLGSPSAGGGGSTAWTLNITAIGSELAGGGTTRNYDNISIHLRNSTAYATGGGTGSGEWDQLGTTQNAELAGDLIYTSALIGTGGIGIGTQDEDLRTQYGIIIKDPETHVADDDLQFLIPGDAVRAKVTFGAYGAIGAAIVDEATTPDEITSVTEGSILVGGPAANKWAADAMGKS
ncbi:MAG: hypothetical protein QF535_14615, partial [Anaerolineales bacterium]|nr:hypothetical protein [Anaerolineales bacterium]